MELRHDEELRRLRLAAIMEKRAVAAAAKVGTDAEIAAVAASVLSTTEVTAGTGDIAAVGAARLLTGADEVATPDEVAIGNNTVQMPDTSENVAAHVCARVSHDNMVAGVTGAIVADAAFNALVAQLMKAPPAQSGTELARAQT